ncbi:unnamed protein product, partial [Ixodes hexagonus]
ERPPDILQWNCRSLRQNATELAQHKQLEQDLDVVALQETIVESEDQTERM